MAEKKYLYAYKDLIEDLKDMANEVLKKGGVVERELWETLFEDVEIRNWEEWKEYFHEEVPSLLKDVLREAGLYCSIYHRKDDVPLPEYIANCETEDGREISFSFDVEYDDVTGEITLLLAEASRGKTPDSILVYYHKVA